MEDQQKRKHDWVYEVLLDLSMYARKNKMPILLRQVENFYENLVPELGSAGRLPELRAFFGSLQKEQVTCMGDQPLKVVAFRTRSGHNSRSVN